jgi:transposase-like protein
VSGEFRQEAVQMALAATSWAAVARRLGMNETALRNWVHDHLAEEARAADPLKVSRPSSANRPRPARRRPPDPRRTPQTLEDPREL